MRRLNRIYKMLPKPRFYLIGLAVAVLFSAYEIGIKGESGGIRSITVAVLIFLCYLTVVNGSGNLAAALQKGNAGSKYFRSLPNAYRNFRRALILNDLFGVLLTAITCATVNLSGLGAWKTAALAAAGFIVFTAAHLGIQMKTAQQSLIVMVVTGALIGIGIGVMAQDKIPLIAVGIIAAVFAAIWIVSTVVLYARLCKLWNRD